jgi:hypothetical protein
MGVLQQLIAWGAVYGAYFAGRGLSLSSPETIDAIKKRLGNIRRDFSEFEIEELVVYGDLEDRLIKANLLH